MTNRIDERDSVAVERLRILAEYGRREREVDSGLYAAWQPGAALMRASSRRMAAYLLHRAAAFPSAGSQCLEVGFGSLGWLADLITWGVREVDLHGIELDPHRASIAREHLPKADLRVGDATDLPWADSTFSLVVASTVFTSILDAGVRRKAADEIRRVLAPGGALLWYDFACNNPTNLNVRKVSRSDIRKLFPDLNGEIRTITLAPPLARAAAPVSWVLANVLEGLPFLRTHLIAALVKSGRRAGSLSRPPGVEELL